MFELFLNAPLIGRLAGLAPSEIGTPPQLSWYAGLVKAFAAAGYDYATLYASDFRFPAGKQEHAKSISQNEGFVITDRESFTRYQWRSPDSADHSLMTNIQPHLPNGLKMIIVGPGGVLENAIALCGYENLAMLVMDDPALAGDIFDAIGARIVRYYELAGKFKNIGAMISNDDWGFAQQTMLSPEDMRRFVFPWHTKIVQAIHAAGVPAILHSCGNLASVMDDVIDVMKFDAKHSYEDKIMPVEEAYARWGKRIAILGGIDVDFVCRATKAQIHERSRRMLELTRNDGGYALGTGNSVPEYVPQENYLAMIQAAYPEARFAS